MIEFADSFWLFLLPVAVVLLVLLFWIDRRGRRASIRRFASGRLVSDLLDSYSPTRKRLKNILLVVAFALLFLSLARPQWGHTWTESRSRGIDLVFALDSSRSMLANDIKPNRLIRAKLAIEDFVNRLEGDRIGLVAFSGSAFLQCPLTLDYDAFFQSLDAVDTNVISAGGTDLAAALQESEAAFSSDNNYKILILITDGEDLEGSGVAQAREAAENGVTVYTVGVGTPEGSPIPLRTRAGSVQYVRDADGRVVHSKLDPETLETIAEETGGFYVNLGPTGYGLEQVLEAGVGSIPEEEISSQLQRTPIERFQWPLAVALLLLVMEPLIGTRRKNWRIRTGSGASAAIIAILSAVGLASPPQASAARIPVQSLPFIPSAGLAQTLETEPRPQADPAESQSSGTPSPGGESAFAQTIRQNPADPVARFNRGTELYEDGLYGQAAKSFTEALRLSRDFAFQADSFYNLGNTRFQEGAEGLAEKAPQALTQEAQGVVRENQPAIRTGEQILRSARAGQIPPQQQIQGAIGALEQREEATTGGIDTLAAGLASENAVKALWQRSLNDFESALELTPEHEDARFNLDFVKDRTAALTGQIKQQEQLKKTQEEQKTRIRELIEELRELLDPQQNQDQNQQQDQQDRNQRNQEQNQDQQQQDQQQYQREQQQQNQDSQQGQRNQQQQQDSSQGRDSQDQSESPQGSEAQEQENANGEEQDTEDTSREGQDRAGEEEESPDEAGTEDQPGDQGDQRTDSGDESTPEDEGRGPEEAGTAEAGSGPEEEQPSETPSGAGGEEDGEEQDSIQLGEEQAENLAEEREEAEAAAREAASGSEEQGEERVLGVMSAEDAARLLDSLKNSERKLPFAGSGSEGAANRGNERNW